MTGAGRGSGLKMSSLTLCPLALSERGPHTVPHMFILSMGSFSRGLGYFQDLHNSHGFFHLFLDFRCKPGRWYLRSQGLASTGLPMTTLITSVSDTLLKLQVYHSSRTEVQSSKIHA